MKESTEKLIQKAREISGIAEVSYPTDSVEVVKEVRSGVCNGIHLYEFEGWIIEKKNSLSRIGDNDKTPQQIAESEFLTEVLCEIKNFLDE